MTSTSPTALLMLPEVAEKLRKSEAQIRWMLHKGTSPKSALIGGRRMFRAHEVDAWIAAQFGDTPDAA